MSLFSSQRKSGELTLLEQGKEVARHLKDSISATREHIASLVELFKYELQEYAACQFRRALAAVVGLFCLLLAYLAGWGCLIIWLSGYVGWLWAIAIMALAHAAVGIFCCVFAVHAKPGPVAQCTRAEIKKDIECLNLFSGKEKSNS